MDQLRRSYVVSRTVSDTLTTHNVRSELPKVLKELFAPRSAATLDAVVRFHFAPEAQLSHPWGLAKGHDEISGLCALLNRIRRCGRVCPCGCACPGAPACVTRRPCVARSLPDTARRAAGAVQHAMAGRRGAGGAPAVGRRARGSRL